MFSHHHFRALLQLRVIILEDKTEETFISRGNEYLLEGACLWAASEKNRNNEFLLQIFSWAWVENEIILFSKQYKRKKRKNLFLNSSKTIMLIYLKHYSECIVSFFARSLGCSVELEELVESWKCKRRLVSRAEATEL